MDLKDSLRRDRVQKKEKEPFLPSLFAYVGGLVRRHGLGAAFCRLIGEMTPEKAATLARTSQSAPKARYEPPLFFLATPKEFQVIQGILTRLDNPYLAWSTSPEEMLLSQPLWARRPGLPSEALATQHFAALLVNDLK